MARSSYKISVPRSLSSITTTTKSTSTRLKTLFAKSFFKRKPELIVNRVDCLVSPLLEGKRVALYNGNSLNFFVVKKSMIGFRFKNLVRTKRLGSIIHIEKRSKKKKTK